MSKAVAVYGSYGHTGALVVQALAERGYDLVLCGRNAEALIKVNDAHAGKFRMVVAAVDDPSALDSMLDGVSAVLNCAGPYSSTALPLASAAIRKKVHYFDPNAVEQLAVQRLFERLDAPARQARVAIVPVTGIFGGLGDVMAHLAARGQNEIDSLTVAYDVEGWIPTRGSQATSKAIQQSKRLAFEDGGFRELERTVTIGEFDFGGDIGPQKVVERYPGSEIATIPRHVAPRNIIVHMALRTIQQFGSADPDWAASVDPETRSKTKFSVVVEVQSATGTQRFTASGRDIYGITAPFMLNSLEQLKEGKCGVLSLSEALEPLRFLDSLRSREFRHDLGGIVV